MWEGGSPHKLHHHFVMMETHCVQTVAKNVKSKVRKGKQWQFSKCVFGYAVRWSKIIFCSVTLMQPFVPSDFFTVTAWFWLLKSILKCIHTRTELGFPVGHKGFGVIWYSTLPISRYDLCGVGTIILSEKFGGNNVNWVYLLLGEPCDTEWKKASESITGKTS